MIVARGLEIALNLMERNQKKLRFTAALASGKVIRMSEKLDQPAVVTVVALRAEDYSADGSNIIISLRTKYSTAERKYSVPVDCFRDLIVDLRRLNASAPVVPAGPIDSDTEPLLPLEPPIAAE